MNIGLFTDTYFPQVSGVSTSIKSLRDELVRQGHFVVIFTTTDPTADDGEDEAIVRLPSIPFVSFEDRRIAYTGFDKALKLARRFKLDIVHTHTEFSLGLAGFFVASRMKIPIVHTYHTLYEKYTHYILDGDLIQAKHVGALSKMFCNQTDGVITPSHMTQEKLREYGIKREIRVIPTGVKIPKYDRQSVIELKRELGIEDNQIIFLSLSRLSKEKSIDKVIEAFSQIEQKIQNSRLLIVGDGPAREELEEIAEKVSENIDFIGEIKHSQVSNYYQIADVYLNASESETQGLTYLEAFANRLPIVAKKNPYLESIMSEKCFGSLYSDEHPIVETTINLITDIKTGIVGTIDVDALNSISVETFGSEVLNYYQDVKKKKKKSKFHLPDIFIPRIKGLIRDVVLGPEHFQENNTEKF